jgi:hypothetical protein
VVPWPCLLTSSGLHQRPPISLRCSPAATALAVMAVLTTGLWSPHLNWTMSGVMISAVFLATLMAHRVLYEAAGGNASDLFYVVMSVGGALGGSSTRSGALRSIIHRVAP